MSVRTLIPFLCLALALASCKKKEAAKAPPASCEQEKSQIAERDRLLVIVRESLDACVQRTPAVPVPVEAPADDPPTKIKAGSAYVLLQGDQVVVMNEQGIGDAAWAYPYGSACRVDPDAKVKVVGAYADKDDGPMYLVRYSREPAPFTRGQHPPDEDPAPRECPDGTLFFLEDPGILFEDAPDRRQDIARKLLNSEKH